MNAIYSNTINELEKMFLRKKNIFFLTATVILTALSSMVINLFQSKFGIAAVIGSNFPVAILGIFVKIVLPLFIFMSASDIFSGETHDKSIKLTLIRPISRFKIFLSKNAALGIYIIINLSLVLLVSFVSGLFFSVKGEVVSGLFHSLEAYGVDIIPAMVLGIMAAFIAQFFRNSSTALISCIFIYIALYVLSMIFPIILRSSFTNYMDWHILLISGTASFSKLLNTFFLILSYGIIFFSTGFYIFDKKDI